MTRKISLGFLQPEDMEDDTIYVNFSFYEPTGSIAVDVKSNEEFVYHNYSLDGANLLNLSTKELKFRLNRDYIKDEVLLRDHPQSLSLADLVNSNDGEISRDRLILDGSRMYTELKEIKSSLKELVDKS